MPAQTRNNLTKKQLANVEKLIRRTQQGTSCPLFCDLEDAAIDYGFPRYFLRSEDGSSLSEAVFFSVLTDEEWHCFFFGSKDNRLLSSALDTVAPYIPEKTTVFAPIAPENEAAKRILSACSATFSYSHYRMVCTSPSTSPKALPDNCHIHTKTVKNEDGIPAYRCLLRRTSDLTGRTETISSCTVTLMGKTAFLSDVRTKKRSQNQGYGSFLLTHVLRDARFSDSNSFALHVESFRRPAVHLYEKLGFSIVEQIDLWELL